MGESINPFEKTVPTEQPHESEIVPLKPEKHPYDPALVEDLIDVINDAEQEERKRMREIEREQIKPTLQ